MRGAALWLPLLVSSPCQHAVNVLRSSTLTYAPYLAALAGGCRFEQSYFDQENWCVVAVKL